MTESFLIFKFVCYNVSHSRHWFVHSSGLYFTLTTHVYSHLWLIAFRFSLVKVIKFWTNFAFFTFEYKLPYGLWTVKGLECTDCGHI
ncbi:hypothetical protein L1987_33224 [Smallanthus sonchifolius]|uniref:Uncharacterized protein n=1 Tax=Smallanthus sonchifolius TaxID=185202 RepID=A0ACB9HQH7_9ASTR|nr:hypothetical protein L1987_33224 [Smallanthus sonchifolius]